MLKLFFKGTYIRNFMILLFSTNVSDYSSIIFALKFLLFTGSMRDSLPTLRGELLGSYLERSRDTCKL